MWIKVNLKVAPEKPEVIEVHNFKDKMAQNRFKETTEVQLLYILILRQTCLVVLVAKHPILYIASLFWYIPL